MSVHNWFRFDFLPVDQGTNIDVTQRIGLGRGWWLSGLFAGAFFGTFGLLTGFPWRTIVLLSALFQLAGLIFGAVVALIVYDGDAAKMTAHVQKVMAAREQRPKRYLAP